MSIYGLASGDPSDGGRRSGRYRTPARLQAALPAAAAGQPFPFAHGLIGHAHAQQRLFRVLVGKRSGQPVLGRFRELVLELVREDLAAFAPAGTGRDAAGRFLAGGLLELLAWSLDPRTGVGPEELERLFLALATPALRAMRRETA